MPLVEFVGVSKSFGSIRAVDGLSFGIERGEFFSLLGPSGCGKSTTLRLLAGLDVPDPGGDIKLDGTSVLGRPPHARRLGMVFQSYALFPHLTVERNVSYGLERHRVARGDIPGRVGRALELVRLPLSEFGPRHPTELSGGQRQRVALARALVLEPELLLLDEPLGAIDQQLRQAMQLELKQLNRTLGITFVYVTHDQDEALSMSDRVAVLEHGRLAQLGTPADLYERPRSRFVASFIGEASFFTAPDGRRVAIRPEQVQLFHPGALPAGMESRPGTVEELSYLGDRIRILLRLGDGTPMVAVAGNHGVLSRPLPWKRGDAVLAAWHPEALLYPEE